MPGLVSLKTTSDKMTVDEPSLDNPDLGPLLLKLARDTIASGDNPSKALDYAIRECTSFERVGGPSLELAMCLHILAAIYSNMGRFGEAVPRKGSDHALAKFSGYMQLGDTHSMSGQ